MQPSELKRLVIKTVAGEIEPHGSVIWCGIPQVNVPWNTYRHTLIEAFETGLAMCRTDCTDEWLVIGSFVAQVVRTLLRFREYVPARVEAGLTVLGNVGTKNIEPIGHIRNIKVYLDPITVPPAEFYVGNGRVFVKGICLNLPIGGPTSEEYEQQRNSTENHGTGS